MSEKLSWRLSGHKAAFFLILYSAQQARMPLEKWESLKSVSKPVQLPPQCITSFHVAALFANLNKSLSILKNAYTCTSLAYKTMSDCFNVRLTAFWIILAVSGLFSQKMNSELTSSLALRDRKNIELTRQQEGNRMLCVLGKNYLPHFSHSSHLAQFHFTHFTFSYLTLSLVHSYPPVPFDSAGWKLSECKGKL